MSIHLSKAPKQSIRNPAVLLQLENTDFRLTTGASPPWSHRNIPLDTYSFGTSVCEMSLATWPISGYIDINIVEERLTPCHLGAANVQPTPSLLEFLHDTFPVCKDMHSLLCTHLPIRFHWRDAMKTNDPIS